MDIVKKNWVSILFGVIALLAIVANMLYVGGKYEELKKEAETRAAVNSTLSGLLSRPRNLPVVTVTEGAEAQAQPLGMFPTPKMIEAGQKATDAVAIGAKKLVDEAVKVNEHQPLVPDALPSGEPVKAIQFARDYIREI